MISTDALRSKASSPILLGRLVAGQSGLDVIAFCTGCRVSHRLPWPGSAMAHENHSIEFDAPCRDLISPYRGGRIRVGLDPRHATANRAILARWRGQKAGVKP